MIGRGTTPTIRFTLNVISPNNIAAAVMTIAQFGVKLVEREYDTAVIGEHYIEWSLTQEETLTLGQSGEVEIQARYRVANGQAYESKIYTVAVQKILHEGVI